MIYKLINNLDGFPYAVLRNAKDSIPFDPANTDYANFKKEILEGAELLDADGKAMTSAQAIAFVKELP